MENVEEQIFSYPHLSVEEQREVEAYVEQHPEWASLFRDILVIESLAREIQVDEEADSLVAVYVVSRHIQLERPSPMLAKQLDSFEQKLKDRPDLQERVEAARRRLERVEAGLDPVAHFEEVTGHTLTTDEQQSTRDAERGASSGSDFSPFSWALVDRVLPLPLAVRGVGALLVALVGVYAVLFAASEASQSTLDRLAAVTVSDQVVQSYYSTNTRSVAAPTDSFGVDKLYLDALSTLRRARTSTLGLFPSYDMEALARVETQLGKVVDRMKPDSFLALEAQFYLGKVYLAQGKVEAARGCFKTVIKQQGRRLEEARTILQTLHETSPTGS